MSRGLRERGQFSRRDWAVYAVVVALTVAIRCSALAFLLECAGTAAGESSATDDAPG
jgi:hypothetical protein